MTYFNPKYLHLCLVTLLIILLAACTSKTLEPEPQPQPEPETETALQLLSAESLSTTSLELNFNQALGSSASVPANYSIEGLAVSAAIVADKTVTLATSEQENQTYTVTLKNIFSAAGAGLDQKANSSSFEGISDSAKPAANAAVNIINLSQSVLTAESCIKAGAREAVADCVETRIRSVLTEDVSSFDVFVPGNANEHGEWKQFNTMNLAVKGRAYLSLQYKHEGSLLNALLYDADVIDGRASLIELLYTLQTRFPETSVRVFGHSQGSHVVAMVADEAAFSNMQFFAIAQAGRTAVDIDSRADIKAAKKGDAGYIHKLSNNLVGITWLNDEVKFFTGKGYVGTMMPEKWGFPGYIWQATTDGTLSSQVRIDHHNSYGGRYTDGLSTNDWRTGEGSTKNNYPYCATGDKSAFDNGNECQKQDTHNSPFFWDNDECREKAFEMMDSASIGEKHYIGYSGPRSAGCQDNVAPIQVNYKLEYRINIGDAFSNHCRYDLQLNFEGLNFSDVPYTRQNGGNITVSTSSSSDTGWLVKTGRISIPYHMRIYLGGSMTDISGRFSDCNGPAQSEAYVRSFEVSFNHPDSGRPITRTLIGLEEGKGYIPPVDLNKKNNVAWYQWNDPNDSRDTDWQLYRAPFPWNALMVKGQTDGNRRGHFFKWVHLID